MTDHAKLIEEVETRANVAVCRSWHADHEHPMLNAPNDIQRLLAALKDAIARAEKAEEGCVESTYRVIAETNKRIKAEAERDRRRELAERADKIMRTFPMFNEVEGWLADFEKVWKE